MDNLRSQHVTKPTRQNSLLGLVITSDPNMVDEVDVIDHLDKCDHSMVEWEMTYWVELEARKAITWLQKCQIWQTERTKQRE